MRLGSSFRRNPFAWAQVAFILICYAGFCGLAFAMGRWITFDDVAMFWPVHVILAINLVAIFGPAKPK